MFTTIATSALSFIPSIFFGGTKIVSSLSPSAKKALIIFMLVVVLYFSYGKQITAWLKNKINPDAPSEAEKELDKDNLSYSDLQYKGWTDSFVAAMRGGGTDEESIYNVFRKMKNRNDVLKIIAEFGKRKYEYSIISSAMLNLYQWFSEEMSAKDMNILNKILQDNNVNFTF